MPVTKIDWEHLHDMAASLGRPIKTLVAMSTQNDPFHLAETRMINARWFKDLYDEHDFPAGVHLRRIHYRLVSQEEPVIMPDGEPYQNTRACSGFLNAAARDARYAALVDIDAFVDRKNPDVELFVPEDDEPPVIRLEETDEDAVAAEVEMSAPEVSVTIKEGFVAIPDDLPDAPGLEVVADCPVPFHVEIWCEKSTMNDILLPLARRNSCALQTSTGEISLTRCNELIQRVATRPIRILYISDFDPGGESMPLAAARKIEWLAQERGLDIQLHPIVLTKEQCEEYELPRTPIKETEHRAGRFEERHGEGATELDALEALRPGTFAEIVQDAIDLFRSEEYVDAWRVSTERAEEAVAEIDYQVRARHQAARQALEASLADLGDTPEAAAIRVMLEDAESVRATAEDLDPAALGAIVDLLIGDDPEHDPIGERQVGQRLRHDCARRAWRRR